MKQNFLYNFSKKRRKTPLLIKDVIAKLGLCKEDETLTDALRRIINNHYA